MAEQLLPTPVGRARLDWFPAIAQVRATLVLGHGTATGVEAADLQRLAATLPGHGVTVVLLTQPYRIEHDAGAAQPAALDQAWSAAWQFIAGRTTSPMIAGGRSAGSQVACRTGRRLGAAAVLALAYPLLGPGSPAELAAAGLPLLIVQATRDPFGVPAQFPTLPNQARLVEIPDGDHMFSAGSGSATRRNLDLIAVATLGWLDEIVPPTPGKDPAP